MNRLRKNIVYRFFTENGLSLLEMVLVITVISILAVAISPVLRGIITAYNMSTVINESYQASRIGLNRMLNEVRMIPQFTSITNSTNTWIRFQDFDNNLVSFGWEGSTLFRAQNGGTPQKLIENVSSFSITYYDVDGNPVASPAQASDYARIEIDVQVGLLGRSANFSGEVSPRNIVMQLASSP